MTLIAAVATAWLVIAAAAAASFVGLLADRLPRGEPVLVGRSHCRACGRALTPLDLVPVLGYVVRRGRCASCSAPIPAAYPVTEGAAALAMLTVCMGFGPKVGGIVGLGMLVAAAGLAIAFRRPSGGRGPATPPPS